VWEIYYGIGNAPSGSKIHLQRAYQRLFIAKPLVELNETIARRAGILRGVHRNSNQKKNLDGADSIVAAIGLAYNESVVSNDTDFQDVDGLTVETY
jgi:predicted nucleic acid-binding protein